jgi:predicted dehydrogenase
MNSSLTPLKFTVLVVGFGKIGAIKSEIWKSLGAEVYVYDVSPYANKRIIEAGYTPFTLSNDTTIKELIVDISTPAAKHATALDWALSTLSVCPRIILLEKPLVSSEAELAMLLDVLRSNSDVNLQNIFVNESYYSSTALRKVKELVSESGESIQGLTVDLSKNRIIDNDNGRFFDYELGAIGIEMPHMIAIAQYFGLDLAVLAKQNAKLHIDSRREDNQGATISYHDHGVAVDFSSFLGDFRIDQEGNVTKNRGVTRMLAVQTHTRLYEVIFDPAPGVPRYHAKVTDTSTVTSKKQTYLFADNHLREHLASFVSYHESDKMDYISLQNIIKICELLFTLRKNALITEDIPAVLEPV